MGLVSILTRDEGNNKLGLLYGGSNALLQRPLVKHDEYTCMRASRFVWGVDYLCLYPGSLPLLPLSLGLRSYLVQDAAVDK